MQQIRVYAAPHKPAIVVGARRRPAMYQQFNEQFAAATRQFADTAAQVNRLALENAEAVFGLQLAALNERANATFAFFGEAAKVRDADGLKTLLPQAAQVARENVERAVSTSQDVIGRTVKANQAIGEIAKSQAESAARTTQSNVQQATKAATDKAEASFANVSRAASEMNQKNK